MNTSTNNKNVLEIFRKNQASICSEGINKERLYEELLQYKNSLNKLREENGLLKGQLNKQKLELSKKDKVLENIITNIEGNNMMNDSSQIKETYLISIMKNEFKELKKKYNEKEEECNNFKKNIKNSKMNEYSIELTSLGNEFKRIKKLYELALQANKENENLSSEFHNIKKERDAQSNLISNYRQIIGQFEDESRMRLDEIDRLNEVKNKQNVKIKSLETQLENQKKINSTLINSNQDNIIIKNLKLENEKKVNMLNKEVSLFVAKAE